MRRPALQDQVALQVPGRLLGRHQPGHDLTRHAADRHTPATAAYGNPRSFPYTSLHPCSLHTRLAFSFAASESSILPRMLAGGLFSQSASGKGDQSSFSNFLRFFSFLRSATN